MRRAARIAGRLLFALLVAALFAPYVLPPFLDRIYYRGPQQIGGGMQGPLMFRFLLGADQAPWPEHVPVTPTKPPPRVAGGAMRVTWIGHATVLVQTQGLNILTDPIWSERASPVSFAGPKRVREPGVRFDDLPRIDLVLVSHDHYDHLDLKTLKRLWQRDRPEILTSLGNDTVLARAGIVSAARDWGSELRVAAPACRGCSNCECPSVASVFVDRVHHWGSRFGKDRNRALWSGFTVVLPGGNLFFAGDTGPGDMRWPAEAARHGPVRFALIPIGAFRPRQLMSGNHLGPKEAVEVFRRLGAAYALGIHWGTFQLTTERIDEPRRYLAASLRAAGIAPDRFRATEVGIGWDVPPLAQSSSSAASASVTAMPKRSSSIAR